MSEFFPSQQFEFGDTWPVGSFRLKSAEVILPEILTHFDIPCWPELTGLGVTEELVGFWTSLYEDWEEKNFKSDEFEKRLMSRPGLKAFLEELSGSPLTLCKGQMIGPVTLMWALKKKDFPIIDRMRVFEFLEMAFSAQAYLCSKVSHNVIISFDEPCGFMNKMSFSIWEEFLNNRVFDQQFGIALHSCGSLSSKWLELNWDVMHFDFEEFLQAYRSQPMAWKKSIEDYFEKGKWLSLGVIRSSAFSQEEDTAALVKEVKELFSDFAEPKILFSTSCGMGDVELKPTVSKLKRLSSFCEEVNRSFSK